jgi:hypothetical protein
LLADAAPGRSFVALCAITTMTVLAARSGLNAASMWGSHLSVSKADGVLFGVSGGIAFDTVSAMVFKSLLGRTILPIFKPGMATAIPGRRVR